MEIPSGRVCEVEARCWLVLDVEPGGEAAPFVVGGPVCGRGGRPAGLSSSLRLIFMMRRGLLLLLAAIPWARLVGVGAERAASAGVPPADWRDCSK